MPRIPEAMKRIADDHNFVLIVMPEKLMDFRYSDAISEIMEAIVKDRLNNTAFVGELLDQVARLPEHQLSLIHILSLTGCSGSGSGGDAGTTAAPDHKTSDTAAAGSEAKDGSGEKVVINFFHRWPKDPKLSLIHI